MKVSVTICSHPNWDSKLVLSPYLDAPPFRFDFKSIAKSYLGVGDDLELLRFTYGATIETDDLRGLLEFDG